jgi:type IV pilus assembly protein PilP
VKNAKEVAMLNRRMEFFNRQTAIRLGGLEMKKIIFLSAAFLFVVVSCGGGTAPLSPPVTQNASSVETKKAKPVQVPEKAQKKESDQKTKAEFAYNPTGKPDPFRPFFQLTRDKRSKGRLTPLQEYDLSQLKLVAIITIPEGNIALVEDSQGKGYFVRKGTVIGKNDGKVKQILKDTVTVEEVYEDVLGQKKVNEVSLLLHRSEKEGENS